MIEINLARHLHGPVGRKDPSWMVYWMMGGLLIMGVIVASWWWTHSLQQQIDSLLQEKTVKIQSLARMKERLKSMEHYGEQKKLLMASIERLKGQEKEKVWPVALLDGISRGVAGLEIWLERVQLDSQVVELHGQSLGLENIGKLIEALEHDQIIKSLPVVEIRDSLNGVSETFPFMIRFVFVHNVTT